MRSLVLLVLVVFWGFASSQSESVLKAVIVIFRHGDRNIISSYPTDPYANLSYWPEGYGQLTNKGKEHQYQLGKWFRKRYQNYLPVEYYYKDIRIQSTDVDRTLMSAEAHLAGLYPPTIKQTWNPDIQWQPIPVHTTPEIEDPILAMEKPCPRYNELYEDLMNSNEFLEIQKQLQPIYDYISNYSGMVVNNIGLLDSVSDTLSVEAGLGYPLPEWTKAVHPEKLTSLRGSIFSVPSYTPELARLKTGLLINEIVSYFVSVSSNASSNYKYKIYSGHDTTIANVLTSLRGFNDIPPPFAASLIFELRQDNQQDIVNIWYKNDTVPLKITLPGCKFDCYINDFVDLLKDITINLSEWEVECNNLV